MKNIVKLNHPFYGDMELNVDRVIAVVPKKHQILFERAIWELTEEEFEKVYKAWLS